MLSCVFEPAVLLMFPLVTSSGAFAQGVIYPLELVKTRMALSGTGEYRGVVHCFRTTVGTEGALGLYRGLWASLVGVSSADLTDY